MCGLVCVPACLFFWVSFVHSSVCVLICVLVCVCVCKQNVRTDLLKLVSKKYSCRACSRGYSSSVFRFYGWHLKDPIRIQLSVCSVRQICSISHRITNWTESWMLTSMFLLYSMEIIGKEMGWREGITDKGAGGVWRDCHLWTNTTWLSGRLKGLNNNYNLTTRATGLTKGSIVSVSGRFPEQETLAQSFVVFMNVVLTGWIYRYIGKVIIKRQSDKCWLSVMLVSQIPQNRDFSRLYIYWLKIYSKQVSLPLWNIALDTVTSPCLGQENKMLPLTP